MARRKTQPFYPRDLYPFETTIKAKGYTGDGQNSRLIDAVQVATSLKDGGRRTFTEGVKAKDLKGLSVYDSHEMGLTDDGRERVNTARVGQWIERSDYDRLTRK